jgi:hypothetical protein
MACKGQELADLPVLFGCPGNDEKIFVSNAIGGSGSGRYAWRKLSDLKQCIAGSVKLPYIGVVGRGRTNPDFPNDPVTGASILQDDSLKGLGATNDGNIQMVIDSTLYATFGTDASFAYDSDLGIIDISPNVFVEGSGVFVDRNQ